MNRKAVSEVVGAMMTLAVIVTTAGIIYMISYPTISQNVENINYRNAVKTMAEIKELVERMKYGSGVLTTKTIQLNMGSIYISDGLNITYQHGSQNRTLKLRSLNIELDERTISLESGIFEKFYDTVLPIPISKAPIIATNDTIYFVFYNFTGNFSAGGSRITMKMEYKNTSKFKTNKLTIESDFCELWKKEIEKEDQMVVSESNCNDRKITVEKLVNGTPGIEVSIVTLMVSQ